MKQRYDCDALPAMRLEGGRWGYLFLRVSGPLAKFALSARIEPERAENIRSRDSHNIYSTAGCHTASIQSP